MFEVWIPEANGCLTQIAKFDNFDVLRNWIKNLQIRHMVCMPYENPHSILITEDKITLSDGVKEFQKSLWEKANVRM